MVMIIHLLAESSFSLASSLTGCYSCLKSNYIPVNTEIVDGSICKSRKKIDYKTVSQYFVYYNNRVDPSMNQFSFYAFYKTKLICTRYKNQIEFC